MDPSSIALQGLQTSRRLNAAAAGNRQRRRHLRQWNAHPDVVDLSLRTIAALVSAQDSFSANLATLETADQIQQNLLDVTA